jgi:mRNA-degrading endonuclease HigB of HigAB toxin-antitoxin module
MKSHEKTNKIALYVIFISLFILVSNCKAETSVGFLIYKQRAFHSDRSAKIVEVKDYKAHPSIIKATDTNGRLIEVFPGQAPLFVPLPTYGMQNLDFAKKAIAEAKRRFPQHKRKITELEAVWKKAETRLLTDASGVHPISDTKSEDLIRTTDGTEYQNVSVINVDSSRLTIQIENGIHGIDFRVVDLENSRLSQKLKNVIEKFFLDNLVARQITLKDGEKLSDVLIDSIDERSQTLRIIETNRILSFRSLDIQNSKLPHELSEQIIRSLSSGHHVKLSRASFNVASQWKLIEIGVNESGGENLLFEFPEKDSNGTTTISFTVNPGVIQSQSNDETAQQFRPTDKSSNPIFLLTKQLGSQYSCQSIIGNEEEHSTSMVNIIHDSPNTSDSIAILCAPRSNQGLNACYEFIKKYDKTVVFESNDLDAVAERLALLGDFHNSATFTLDKILNSDSNQINELEKLYGESKDISNNPDLPILTKLAKAPITAAYTFQSLPPSILLNDVNRIDVGYVEGLLCPAVVEVWSSNMRISPESRIAFARFVTNSGNWTPTRTGGYHNIDILYEVVFLPEIPLISIVHKTIIKEINRRSQNR